MPTLDWKSLRTQIDQQAPPVTIDELRTTRATVGRTPTTHPWRALALAGAAVVVLASASALVMSASSDRTEQLTVVGTDPPAPPPFTLPAGAQATNAVVSNGSVWIAYSVDDAGHLARYSPSGEQTADVAVEGEIGNGSLAAIEDGVAFTTTDELGTGTGLYALTGDDEPRRLVALPTSATVSADDGVIWTHLQGSVQAYRSDDGTEIGQVAVEGYGWVAATDSGEAFVSERDVSQVRRLGSDGAVIATAEIDATRLLGAIAVSPDGTTVAVTAGQEVRLLSADLDAVATVTLDEVPGVVRPLPGGFVVLTAHQVIVIRTDGSMGAASTDLSATASSVAVIDEESALVCALEGVCAIVDLPDP